MSLSYIRERYKVPARVGGPVRYQGRMGVITGATEGRLMIRLAGENHSNPYHPTWELEYGEENGPATRVPVPDPRPAPAWLGAFASGLTEPLWSGL